MELGGNVLGIESGRKQSGSVTSQGLRGSPRFTTTQSQKSNRKQKQKRTDMKLPISSILTATAALLLGCLAAPVSADILYVTTNSTITAITGAGSASVFANIGAVSNYGLAFDSARNLYQTSVQNSSITRFTPGGVGSSFGGGTNQPIGLAFDGAGNLYVANFGNNTIERITPGGTFSLFTSLSRPSGLAFDSAGNLYVSSSTNVIEKYTASGGILSPVGSVFASTGLSDPDGLAFDRAGNLYVANGAPTNLGGNTIMKFTMAGTASLFASTGLNRPLGLAFDSAGNLYAANSGGSTIEKFSPTGTDLGVLATVPNIDSSPRELAFTDDAGVPLRLANQVPEPTIWAMLGLGAAFLVGVRRFRHRA